MDSIFTPFSFYHYQRIKRELMTEDMEQIKHRGNRDAEDSGSVLAENTDFCFFPAGELCGELLSRRKYLCYNAKCI
jgi:hypothetical protein